MAKYDDTPWWWFLGLLILSFLSGLVVIIRPGGIGLGFGGYILALLVGCEFSAFDPQYPEAKNISGIAFIAPFSNLLYARMGSGIATAQLMKMIGGAIYPGKPVANLFVCAIFQIGR